MAFDSPRARVVMFGGSGVNGAVGDTWEWDGSTWTAMVSTSSPSARAAAAMAYDRVRGKSILFGGSMTSLGPQSDTWEWDGTDWTPRPVAGPRARNSHTMAFDDSRGVTVLFGGEDTYSQPSSFFGDTWEWDGLAWSQANVTGPAARGRHTMVFDTHRARTVLFGGTTGTNGESDTWEYDGASWQQSPVIGPPWRFQHAMAFDEARRQMVMFGGFAPSGSNSGDTWTFSAPVNAAFTPIGQGCPGPAGTLQLHAVPGSLPILGQTFSMQVTNLPASIFAVPFGAVGFSNQSFAGAPLPAALDGIGAPGCTLFVSIDQEFVLANQSGTANWSIPVPFDLSLLGLDAYVQSAVLVPGFNPANLVVSNAGHVVVGSQ